MRREHSKIQYVVSFINRLHWGFHVPHRLRYDRVRLYLYTRGMVSTHKLRECYARTSTLSWQSLKIALSDDAYNKTIPVFPLPVNRTRLTVYLGFPSSCETLNSRTIKRSFGWEYFWILKYLTFIYKCTNKCQHLIYAASCRTSRSPLRTKRDSFDVI